MSLGEQFLEGTEKEEARAEVQSSNTPQQPPTLRTVLEKHNAMLVSERVFDGSNDNVGEYVRNVYVQAFGIIHEGSGLGASGECPFASAYEVHLFYQFCLNVCVSWSEHQMGKDERRDNNFYSQMSDLCAILSFLDTDAVPLPEEIDQNIKLIQREALFPHWVDAQMPKGEAALECCINVGKKWGLGETEAFQKALAALQGNHRASSVDRPAQEVDTQASVPKYESPYDQETAVLPESVWPTPEFDAAVVPASRWSCCPSCR